MHTKTKKLKLNSVTIETKNNCFLLYDHSKMLESPADYFRYGIISNEFIKSSLNTCSNSESALGFNNLEFENNMRGRILEMIQVFKIDFSLKKYLSIKITFLKHINEVDSEYLQTYNNSNEMKHKIIVSELTNKFLINNIFPDWKSWDNLLNETSIEKISEESLKQIQDYQRKCKYSFNLRKEDFRNIVDTIPYILIDKLLVCPCLSIFRGQYFTNLNISRPIRHYECNSIIFFKTIDDIIAHLKPDYIVILSLTKISIGFIIFFFG